MQAVELAGSRRISRLAAPFVQRDEALAEIEPNALAAASGIEIGDVRLRRADLVPNLSLGQPCIHEVCDDFFPHEPYDSNCCRLTQQRALVQHLLSGGYVASMEIDEIRRRRLREWIDTDPVSMGDVEAWCGYYSQFVQKDESPLSPTYIRQLVPKRGTPNRNIGEKVARRLERIGNKPAGWLDTSPSEGASLATPAVRAPSPPTINDTAPFQRREQTYEAERGRLREESRRATNSTTADHSAALRAQIAFLRQSAAAVAQALKISPEDLVSAGADARARVEAALSGDLSAQGDDEVDGISVARPAADHGRPRQTRNVTTAKFLPEVEPRTDDERAATASPRKERRS